VKANTRGMPVTGYNEINIMGISGYVGGALLFEEGKQDLSDMYQAVHHQFVASSLVTKFAHELKADLKVGMMLARMEAYPFRAPLVPELGEIR
ncbi:UNVERIFIED_CONTAM: family 1 glycosylhydrolase, partial [Aerococcus urinaeequi]